MHTEDLFRSNTPQSAGEDGLTLPGAQLRFIEHWLMPDAATDWFDALMKPGAVRWRQDHIRMYGREVAIPRLNAWYGDTGADYMYSGIPLSPEPWSGLLQEIRMRVQREVSAHFTSVLINLYRDGQDSVAWHADDEPELGAEPLIASLSLGATREFQMRHRRARENGLPVFKLPLPSGSLLVMSGPTQKNWLHQVPKRLGRNLPGPRINLTFRRIQTPGQHTARVIKSSSS